MPCIHAQWRALHLLELREQRVDLLHAGVATSGDAAAAAGIKDGLIAALGEGHGVDRSPSARHQ